MRSLPSKIYKKEGQTPLEALELLRREKGIDPHTPMTYAGRLDPMAEGLLLILVGDECKKKDEYLGLDKEYEVEILLGIGSDTGDILGMVKNGIKNMEMWDEGMVKEKIQLLIGKRSEKYPMYSSKTVNGKPLFVHTKEGNIEDVEIPEKEIEIYSVDFLGVSTISPHELVATAIDRIKKVKGDFRQNEIASSWEKLLQSAEKGPIDNFSIIKLQVRSSSGAYMRTLAEKLGELLGTKALAWKIKRTKIGKYSL